MWTNKSVYIVKCEYKAIGSINTSVEIEGVFSTRELAQKFIDECNAEELKLPEHKRARFWSTKATFYEAE
jgi:flagellar biosynthesis regulator FlaF